MKKLLLLVCAFVASMASAVAQDANVAQGATVTVIGANDNAGTPADMVDGNNATFWQGNSWILAPLRPLTVSPFRFKVIATCRSLL